MKELKHGKKEIENKIVIEFYFRFYLFESNKFYQCKTLFVKIVIDYKSSVTLI
jgi:hypothetical protein